MTHGALAQTAALLGAAGSALVILPPPRRAAIVGGTALIAAAEAMLTAALLPRHDLERFTSAPGAAALVAGAIAAAALAWAFVRWPTIVPVCLLAAAPFRLPVDLGSQHAFLLLPSLPRARWRSPRVYSFARLRGDELSTISPWLSGPRSRSSRGRPSRCSGRSTSSRDRSSSCSSSSRSQPSSRSSPARPYADWLPRALAVTLIGLATLFAAIGLYQAWSHTLIFAQDLRVANAYTTYFRVTSLFKDPSIYGRHLVLAISLLVVLLWLARVRLAYALALVAVLFGGLYFSYSQSSMVVLFVIVCSRRRSCSPTGAAGTS